MFHIEHLSMKYLLISKQTLLTPNKCLKPVGWPYPLCHKENLEMNNGYWLCHIHPSADIAVSICILAITQGKGIFYGQDYEGGYYIGEKWKQLANLPWKKAVTELSTPLGRNVLCVLTQKPAKPLTPFLHTHMDIYFNTGSKLIYCSPEIYFYQCID